MDNKKIIVTLITLMLVFWVFGLGVSKNSKNSVALQQLETQNVVSASDTFSRFATDSSSQAYIEPVSIAGNADLEKDYITDMYGRTLYTKKGPACVGECLTLWPPYKTDNPVTKSGGKLGTVYNENIPALQYTWDGNYLYYYAEDKNLGDIKGNGIGGVWAVVEM
ncbi:MAG: hypothetical protein Q8R36_00105 [bacterium]|nr:hypothetical protein [bacterium]